MDLIAALANLEEDTHLHEARLLLLLSAFLKGDGHPIEGITKLAKLDFLLRYPTLLERALKAKGYSLRDIEVRPHERHSVESRMVRYRFGPWDHRYRSLLASLQAKGLVEMTLDGRTVTLSMTHLGLEAANRLEQRSEFADTVSRAALLRRRFDITGTALMKFIYATFPEIASLRANQEI